MQAPLRAHDAWKFLLACYSVIPTYPICIVSKSAYTALCLTCSPETRCCSSCHKTVPATRDLVIGGEASPCNLEITILPSHTSLSLRKRGHSFEKSPMAPTESWKLRAEICFSHEKNVPLHAWPRQGNTPNRRHRNVLPIITSAGE